MNVFRRLSATIHRSFEGFVTSVEDHDAVVESALKTMRRSTARARVQLNRVRQDGNRLQRQHDKTRQEIEQWETRARQCATEDEERALGCIKRRNQCKNRLVEFDEACSRQSVMQRDLEENLRRAEEKIEALSRQRHAMRTRQSTSDALRIIESMESPESLELDKVFEEWDVKLSEREILQSSVDFGDEFEHEFLKAEESESLRGELDALINRED